jgi:hypothetical protein
MHANVTVRQDIMQTVNIKKIIQGKVQEIVIIILRSRTFYNVIHNHISH